MNNIYKKLGIRQKKAKPGDLLTAMRKLPQHKAMAMGKPLFGGGGVRKALPVLMKQYSVAQDKAYDRAHGMKEGSARDNALDAKRGLKMKRKPKLGSGKRFAQLKAKLGKRKGVTNPGALAAAIGRRRYGKKRFQAMAAAGRKKKG